MINEGDKAPANHLLLMPMRISNGTANGVSGPTSIFVTSY